MMLPERSDESDRLTAEEEVEQAELQKKVAHNRHLIDDLIQNGWKWSETEKDMLVSPEDKALFAWRDPYTQELLLSPKLAESLLAGIRRGRGEGSQRS